MSGIEESEFSCTLINEAASATTLQDGINERLSQALAIITALTIDTNEDLAEDVKNDVLWAVSRLIDETRELNRLQWKKVMVGKIRATRALNDIETEDLQ